MGNKIRVELSRGGGKSAKYGDPGACFKCGQMGHWARLVQFVRLSFLSNSRLLNRECPNHP